MNKVYPNSALPIEPGIGPPQNVTSSKGQKIDVANRGGFQDLLQELQLRKSTEGGSLKFSAHARQRLASRKIELGRDTMQRLDQAVARAAEKGAKDALMFMPGKTQGEDLAFVVSVTNRTVITAMDGKHITENVFTNIDSAMVVT
jgi:flagellar operon protein